MSHLRACLLALFILFGMHSAHAQCSILSSAVQQSLTLTGGSSYTKYAVAYNPQKNIYYTSNGNYIQVHSAASGGLITSYTHYSKRGMWWNSNLNQLEGNGYGTTGIFKYSLNTSGYPTSVSTVFSGSNHQPSYQQRGVYDDDNNEILYVSGTTLYRYSRVTGSLIGTLNITGLPSTSFLTTYGLIYTGCLGKDVKLLGGCECQGRKRWVV